MDPALESLDTLIAQDPDAQRWSFADHERGALHEAERIMTLAGKDEEIGVAKKRGPRAITDIRKLPSAGPEASASPGTEELCRFIRLLHLINRHCPWAPHPFEVNDAILRELTSAEPVSRLPSPVSRLPSLASRLPPPASRLSPPATRLPPPTPPQATTSTSLWGSRTQTSMDRGSGP